MQMKAYLVNHIWTVGGGYDSDILQGLDPVNLREQLRQHAVRHATATLATTGEATHSHS